MSTIANSVTFEAESTNYGSVQADTVIFSQGAVNGVAGSVEVPVTGSVTIGDGCVNSGTIAGPTTIAAGGVNTVFGNITGNVVVSGTNAGAIIGNVKVTGTGEMTVAAAVTGTVLLEAGATNAAVVTGTLYVAAGATNTGSVASGGTLIAATIVDGVTTVTTNGFTFTGVAYNLEGNNKAYSYTAGVNSGLYTGIYLNLQADGLNHSYVEGVDIGTIVVKNGYYTDGYYVDNVLTPNPGEVGEDYIPHEALNAPGHYYYYSRIDGSATIASGYRVAGYYVNGVLTAAPDSAVHQADNSGSYIYSTEDGTSTIAAGYYTEGYYVSGTGAAAPNNAPHEALNDADHYYTYSTEAFGIGTLASGFYSNGYYESGTLTSVTPGIRASAIDRSLVYYYNLLTASLTDGYYAGGYYEDGVLTAAPDNNPHEAIDEAGVYYTYSMEDGVGSFFNGSAYNLQGDNKAYSYSSGVGSLFTGYANLQVDGLYHYYASGVDGGVKHQFTGPAIKPAQGPVTVYWDKDPLASGDTLYASQTSGFTSVDLDYYTGTDGVSGYTHVTADASGVATVTPVDHSYGGGSIWYDNSTPVEGDTIYTGRYTNNTANNAALHVGNEGSQGYARIATDGSGLVLTIELVDHQYSVGGSYYGDTSPLASGDTIYTGRFTDATASYAGFYVGTDGSVGYTRITTNGSGVATVTPVDHSYGSGYIWYDNSTIASGDTLYTGQYTHSKANNLDYYIGTDGSAGYTHITTNGSGVATVTPVDHSYGGGSIWYDNSAIASGDTLYTGQYTNATANYTVFYAGTENGPGYTRITTNASGVATFTPVDHSYGSGSTWYNNSTLASGDIIYTGRYTDATAYNLDYYIGTDGSAGYAHITTNASGVATVTPIDHSNSVVVGGSTYYSNIGSTTLYTERYITTLATPTGLGSNMYYYDAQSNPSSGPYTQIENGVASMFSSCHYQTDATQVGLPISTGLNVGGIVRNADGSIFSSGHFEFTGSLYTVNATTGAITLIEPCNPYN